MTAVRHRFSCPLRWADLDMLGHVNNVRYADYMREARDDLAVHAGLDLGPAGFAVARHELTFLAPLMFGFEPVVVECWLSDLGTDSATVEYQLTDGRTTSLTYLRSRSVVSARDAGGVPRPFTPEELTALSPYVEDGTAAGDPVRVEARPRTEAGFPLQVRAGDLDVTGVASDVAFVEFFQEARIGFFEQLLHELPDTGELRWVVAQTDIDYVAPMTRRSAPYRCFTRLVRLGNKSLTVESVILDQDGAVRATAHVVLVVFNPVTQRAAEPPESYRVVLEGLVDA